MTKLPIVKDIMAKRVVSLRAEMAMHEAIAVLLKHKISGAPVTNGDNEVVGILSEKDCLKMFTKSVYTKYPEGRVSDFMSTEIVSCGADDDLFFIANLFFKHSFRRIPVIESGKLLGLVSRPDVLQSAIELWQNGDSEVEKAWSDSVYLTEEIKAALG